ncbi:traB domain-containing protein-like isoform X1 [Juglans microcarpa x Juglans regia]|uniref:traB domain-containing protein-like isoform X1 n=2 Tax=Juglans microcarpa x Juglans regia TaxID=2249226 RepID=UPI001B7E0E10|nr:traB domain-containing protein-like isoform X1 [Juglans microcarpa x Juglans regia]
MIRPTHLVSLPNSVGSLRLFGFASGSARLSVRRAQNAHTLASLVHFSASRQSKITFSASSLDRRKPPHSSHPAMDAHATSANANGEDFVHIENPGADESLSESIVNIEEEPPSGDDDDDSESSEQTKAVLPEELSRSVVALTCDSVAKGGVCDVYLVGTAHVSQESCREVQAVISFLKPQVVFLELCSSCVAVLTPQNIKVPTMGEMLDMWKKKHNIFGILYSWFLAKVASKLEVFPGSEFRVAYEEAMKYGGRVFLGDIPVQITIRRTWAKMPLWHKIKLLYTLFFQAVFLPSSEDLNRMLKEMDDVDMLTLVIQEMSKEFPTLMETLVHERDKYMSSRLLRIASENSLVVAVVGKGHLQGIKKNWKQPIGVKDLLTMPPQKPAISTVNILTSLGVAVAGVAILSGIYLANKK